MVTNRGDLRRQVDFLRNLHLAGLKRAFEINVTNLLAQIGRGTNESNQTVLDRELDVCALCNLLLNVSLRLDDQLLTTVDELVACSVLSV